MRVIQKGKDSETPTAESLSVDGPGVGGNTFVTEPIKQVLLMKQKNLMTFD